MTSKEKSMRTELGMVHLPRAKIALPLSSLKSVPLDPPGCLQSVSEHLANVPSPFVGLQVPQSLRKNNRLSTEEMYIEIKV